MSRPKSRAQRRKEQQGKKKDEKIFFMGMDVSSPEQAEKLVRQMLQSIANGQTPQEAFDIQDEVLEYIYSLGFAFYQGGQYEKAYPLFHFLSLISFQNPKYFYALGAVQQMREKWTGAMEAYLGSFMLNTLDPTPLVRFAECGYKCGMEQEAKESLEQAIEIAKKNPELSELQERAQAMLR